MTHKHISFPSIKQFRDIVKQVRDNCKYHNVPNPTLNFRGSVKLHGTNHGVCLSPEGEIYTQSRERVTTPGSDNAGSSAWTFANIDTFNIVFNRIKQALPVSDKDTIQIYGEFCGGSIQKNVGLNKLDKMFVVFGIRISENSDSQYFLPPVLVSRLCAQDLLCIFNFPTFSISIDFNEPEASQNYLGELTNLVERDCPVARAYVGPSEEELIGEGIVWETTFNGNTLRFKVKGDKHSSSKVKTLATVDTEKVNSVKEFVEYACTTNRLTQGLEHVPDRTTASIGAFIKWIVSDIVKEEIDTLVASGLTTKDVSTSIANKARQWFLTLDQ